MNLASAFAEMKKIYGICPCCDEPFRLSEATLFTKSRPPTTIFERLRQGFELLERKIEKFQESEERSRGLARQRGQMAARKRIRTFAPFFVDRKIEPKEVKVLFHPVDYIIFKGMNSGRCASVDFIDHSPRSREREVIQRSIENVIQAGNLSWQTLRVDESGRVVCEAEGKPHR